MRSIVAVTVLLVALGAALDWLMAGDPVSQRKWDRVQKGMSRAEVIRIMGKPDTDSGDELEYRRRGNVGWVEFHFDAKGMLVEKNDESAFGSLR